MGARLAAQRLYHAVTRLSFSPSTIRLPFSPSTRRVRAHGGEEFLDEATPRSLSPSTMREAGSTNEKAFLRGFRRRVGEAEVSAFAASQVVAALRAGGRLR